jgi:hypothetical protein
MRWTWVVVAGVGALLLLAGVDALRSSGDSEASAPTATATSSKLPRVSLPPCTQQDISISIEVRDGGAVAVARNIGAEACYRLLRGWRVRIEDRAGTLVEERVEVRPLADGLFPTGSERAFWLTPNPVLCVSPGPYVALVTVGPYTTRLASLSRSEVACGGDVGYLKGHPRARYVVQADAICNAATNRFQEEVASLTGPQLFFETDWSDAAAGISEQALAELRALAPPKGDRARVNEIYSLMERRTDVLRQAASAGNIPRIHMLWEKSVRLTERKDKLVIRVSELWGVSPDLRGCPIKPAMPGASFTG